MDTDKKFKQKILDKINAKKNKNWDKHSVRLFCGSGVVFLIYFFLRTIEKECHIGVFMVWFLIVSYTLGWLADRGE